MHYMCIRISASRNTLIKSIYAKYSMHQILDVNSINDSISRNGSPEEENIKYSKFSTYYQLLQICYIELTNH